MNVEVKITDRGFDEMIKRGRKAAGPNGPAVKVGVLADGPGGLHEVGPDGKASPLTLAEIAAVLEFGTRDGNIPARSVIRRTADAWRERLVKWGSEMFVKHVVDGSMSLDDILNRMGAKLAAEMKNTITRGEPVPPPNAPEVADRKRAKGHGGTIRTWVDTGRLVNAFSWVIERATGGSGDKPQSEREVQTGSRGGRFHRSASGGKVYHSRE